MRPKTQGIKCYCSIHQIFVWQCWCRMMSRILFMLLPMILFYDLMSSVFSSAQHLFQQCQLQSFELWLDLTFPIKIKTFYDIVHLNKLLFLLTPILIVVLCLCDRPEDSFNDCDIFTLVTYLHVFTLYYCGACTMFVDYLRLFDSLIIIYDGSLAGLSLLALFSCLNYEVLSLDCMIFFLCTWLSACLDFCFYITLVY